MTCTRNFSRAASRSAKTDTEDYCMCHHVRTTWSGRVQYNASEPNIGSWLAPRPLRVRPKEFFSIQFPSLSPSYLPDDLPHPAASSGAVDVDFRCLFTRFSSEPFLLVPFSWVFLGRRAKTGRADHPSLTPPFGKKCYILRKKVDSARDSCFFSGRRGGV